MIRLAAVAAVTLRHRAFHLGIANSGDLVAVSQQGVASLIGPQDRAVRGFELSHCPTAVAISPTGDRLAIVREGALQIMRLSDLVEVEQLDGPFEGCFFSAHPALLWTVKRLNTVTASVEVRETTNWSVQAHAEVKDPFGSSGFLFFPHPKNGHVSLWVAAGQEGQCIYWARYNGEAISIERFPSLDEITPPAFDASGSRFLVVLNGDVCVFQYPQSHELGRMHWPFDDDPAGEIVSFVGDDYGLVQSSEGRLFLIDLRRMNIAEEIVIDGHEPRPVGQLYPGLSHESGLCSDLCTFALHPHGGFVSAHQLLPFKSLAEWRDQLLWWKIPYSGP